jgi:glycosyltransferase involved in cell wall biosynthesis
MKVHGSDVLNLDENSGRRRRTIDALCQADGIVAVSQDLAQRVISLGADPQRVQLVYNGIDSRLFRPGSQKEARAQLGLEQQDRLVLFVGNLVLVKGLKVLLDACAHLVQGGLRFRCLLIGDGPLRGKLEMEIARRQLQSQVHLMGARSHQQLPAWYRAADVLVLPSYSEGVPNVLLEAAACGTPFVASHVGGIPEIAHMGDAQLVSPGDATALARAVAGSLKRTSRRSPEASPGPRSHEEAALELAGFLTQVRESYQHRIDRPYLISR